MPRISNLTRTLVATLLLTACDAPHVSEEVVLGEPMIAEASARKTTIMPSPAPIPLPPSRGTGKARAGVVTAGDIDDTLNLEAFTRYQARSHKALSLPMANLSRPILAQLRNPNGSGAAGVSFSLRKQGAAEPFHTGRSGVDGEIAVFPAVLGAGRPPRVEMRVIPEGAQAASVVPLRAGKRSTLTLPTPQNWKPDFLDLVFVVDTTGSMGDELAWLLKELKQITKTAKRAAPGVDIRYGLVSYKAPGDPVPVHNYGFTKSESQMRHWLRAQTADGGSGGPEVVSQGLESAVDMSWRRGKGERLLIQIGDEPPRTDRTRAYLNAAAKAARNGVQIFGLGASGVEDHLEYLMRQSAAVTGGRYMFLTDDSGVGFGHAEPKVTCYQVTALSNLVSRVLRSELTGTRVEATPPEVVREVGSYRRGRCVN